MWKLYIVTEMWATILMDLYAYEWYLLVMEKKEILMLHKEYYEMFGRLPPISMDDVYYDPKSIQAIKAAIGRRKPL